jgi:hypothetical protein
VSEKSYKELLIWQKGIKIVVLVYKHQGFFKGNIQQVS